MSTFLQSDCGYLDNAIWIFERSGPKCTGLTTSLRTAGHKLAPKAENILRYATLYHFPRSKSEYVGGMRINICFSGLRTMCFVNEDVHVRVCYDTALLWKWGLKSNFNFSICPAGETRDDERSSQPPSTHGGEKKDLPWHSRTHILIAQKFVRAQTV